MDLQAPQVIAKNFSSNILYLFKYDKNDFMINLEIDSLNRLQFTIKKYNNEFPCCCICLEDFDKILQNKQQCLIKTSCNHLYCLKDFEEMQIRHNQNQTNLKCLICRQAIRSIIELKETDCVNPVPNSINLRVNNFKRMDIDYFISAKCKNCGQLGLPALVKCCLCDDQSSNYCVTCIVNPANIEFIKKEYHRILFYCGCTISFSFLSLQNRQPSEIESLHALYQTNPSAYGNILAQRINQYNIQQIISWQEIYCPECPLKVFKFNFEKKRHINKKHNALYHLLYPETVKCSFCQTSFANQQTLNRHKCKKIQAPQQFFQN